MNKGIVLHEIFQHCHDITLDIVYHNYDNYKTKRTEVILWWALHYKS